MTILYPLNDADAAAADLKRLGDQATADLREATRGLLVAKKMAALLEPFPRDTSITTGVAAGLFTKADVLAAMGVTDEEIDDELVADWQRRARAGRRDGGR